ncbi:helix-turn-helix domain-containing protein [Bacillus weihaiensis]|uniref:HTH cro/C1-type domain-containing protein n=1 Tax=Bacillus weihaiensis TaxID=1547283 RepID=A0A1L3MMI7_9BACI|nr:helix-turn-helix domain-containing protein [Bacillus weihaiensis]APH03531.1 hypothetical protein A9C19_01500 [Bacillus weihaiensis]
MYEPVEIGHVIKGLRKSMNLSQQQLAEGICTQAQISKIENSNEIPSSLILYKLSRKLGVDMNYFFEIAETPRLDYVRDVYKMIRFYIRERDYESVSTIVKQEKKNPLFQTVEHKQFLLWHEGVCEFYLYGNKQLSMAKINEALFMTYKDDRSSMKEREIEIGNSLAILYKEREKYEQALGLYTKLLQSIKNLDGLKDESIQLRIYYGIAKAYTDIREYQKSLYFVNKGIQIAMKLETMYLLGELYFQCGSNHYRLGDVVNGDKYVRKSRTLFELQGKVEMVNVVDELKRELEEQRLFKKSM